MMPRKIGSGVAIAWASYSCAAACHYPGRNWPGAQRQWIARLAWTQPPSRPLALGSVDNAQDWEYDVAPDGRFLINAVLDNSAIAPITVLTNWNPEAKK